MVIQNLTCNRENDVNSSFIIFRWLRTRLSYTRSHILSRSLDSSSNQTVRSFTLVVFLAITRAVPFDRPRWKLYQVDTFHVKPLPVVALWFLISILPWQGIITHQDRETSYIEYLPCRPIHNKSSLPN